MYMHSLYPALVGVRECVGECVCVHRHAGMCVCMGVHMYVGIRAYRCAHGGWLQVFICGYMHGRVDINAFVVAGACACRAMYMCLMGPHVLFIYRLRLVGA